MQQQISSRQYPPLSPTHKTESNNKALKMKNFLSRLSNSQMAMKLRRAKQRCFPRPEYVGIAKNHPLRFTERCRGVIHIGAHTGEEAWIYAALKVPVLWIEANPLLIPRLQDAIRGFSKQVAIQALLTDSPNETIPFVVTNNDGASSSILELADHRKIFPDVQESHRVLIKSTTLKNLLTENSAYSAYDAIVIDVQGAELLALKGAGDCLRKFRYIYAECADFEMYSGGCTLAQLAEWLETAGFFELRRDIHKTDPTVGTVYDVLFARRST
jgi:FkbM family methyltransferase